MQILGTALDITDRRQQDTILRKRRESRLPVLEISRMILDMPVDAALGRELFREGRGHLGVDLCLNFLLDENASASLLVGLGIPERW